MITDPDDLARHPDLARHEEERFLRRSLDDLEREHAAGDLDDADFASLRADYERRIARLDEVVSEELDALPAPRPRRVGRAVATVGAVLVLAIGAGMLVAASAGDRGSSDTATGSITESSNEKLARAQECFGAGDAVCALKLWDEVLVDDPDNPVALSYGGWLRYLTGEPDLMAKGKDLLEQSVAAAPGYADAYVFLGLIARQEDRVEDALAYFDEALSLDPDPAIVELVRPARDALAAELAPDTTAVDTTATTAVSTTAG